VSTCPSSLVPRLGVDPDEVIAKDARVSARTVRRWRRERDVATPGNGAPSSRTDAQHAPDRPDLAELGRVARASVRLSEVRRALRIAEARGALTALAALTNAEGRILEELDHARHVEEVERIYSRR
jgi:hypothetical protein